MRTEEYDADGVDLGQQPFSRVVPGNSICENLVYNNLVINILSNTFPFTNHTLGDFCTYVENAGEGSSQHRLNRMTHTSVRWSMDRRYMLTVHWSVQMLQNAHMQKDPSFIEEFLCVYTPTEKTTSRAMLKSK